MRALYRYVRHAIGRDPDSDLVMTVRCLTPDCGWTIAPTTNFSVANDACMAHAGRNRGHERFAREWADVAVVRRLGAEGARGGPDE